MINLKTELVKIMVIAALVFSAPVLADVIESPVHLLQRKSDEVIKLLEDKKEELAADTNVAYRIVDEHIVPHLDDVTMAKLALGKNWRKASNDQKIMFVDEFRTLLIRTYGKSLQEFSGQKIKFFPVDIDDDTKKVVVKSEVLQSGGPTIPISYRMRLKDNAWKVYDINIDGVSLVTSYRGTFTQEVRKGGIDGLLDMLKEKNSKVVVEPVNSDSQVTNTSQKSS